MASTTSPGGSETWPSSPSGSGSAQSAKAKRYDRQSRLWGAHGQMALERSRVCVINATPLGMAGQPPMPASVLRALGDSVMIFPELKF
mgnify:CR=1 FL=1